MGKICLCISKVIIEFSNCPPPLPTHSEVKKRTSHVWWAHLPMPLPLKIIKEKVNSSWRTPPDWKKVCSLMCGDYTVYRKVTVSFYSSFRLTYNSTKLTFVSIEPGIFRASGDVSLSWGPYVLIWNVFLLNTNGNRISARFCYVYWRWIFWNEGKSLKLCFMYF